MSQLLPSGGQSIGASASASVLPVNIQLVSFRIGCFDIFAVRGILKCLLQHHKPKASILCHSAFLMIEVTHLYMTTEKAIVLTIRTFVSKVMSLFFFFLYHHRKDIMKNIQILKGLDENSNREK